MPHTRLSVLMALALVATIPAAGGANDTTAASLQGDQLAVQVSVDVKELRLPRVLSSLGKLAGFEFKVDPTLDYRVSFDLRNMPLRTILEVIETSQSIAYRQDGNTVLVEKVAPEPFEPLQ